MKSSTKIHQEHTEQQANDHEHEQDSRDQIQDQSPPISLCRALEMNFDHFIPLNNEAVQTTSYFCLGDLHQQDHHCSQTWQFTPSRPSQRELVDILDEAIGLLDEDLNSARHHNPSNRLPTTQ